jgi:hypothetical protein
VYFETRSDSYLEREIGIALKLLPDVFSPRILDAYAVHSGRELERVDIVSRMVAVFARDGSKIIHAVDDCLKLDHADMPFETSGKGIRTERMRRKYESLIILGNNVGTDTACDPFLENPLERMVDHLLVREDADRCGRKDLVKNLTFE